MKYSRINSKEISDLIRLYSHQANTIIETIDIGFRSQTTQKESLMKSIEELHNTFSEFYILSEIESVFQNEELLECCSITDILNHNLISQTFSLADYSIRNNNFSKTLILNKLLVYIIFYSFKLFNYLKNKPFIESVELGHKLLLKIGSENFKPDNTYISKSNLRKDYYLLYKNIIEFTVNKISYFSRFKVNSTCFEIIISSEPYLLYELKHNHLVIINEANINIDYIKAFCDSYLISIENLLNISYLRNISNNKSPNFILHSTKGETFLIKYEKRKEKKLNKKISNIKQIMPAMLIQENNSELDILHAFLELLKYE